MIYKKTRGGKNKERVPKDKNPNFLVAQWYHKLKKVLNEKPDGVMLLQSGRDTYVSQRIPEGVYLEENQWLNVIKIKLGPIIDLEVKDDRVMVEDKGVKHDKTMERRTDRGAVSDH